MKYPYSIFNTIKYLFPKVFLFKKRLKNFMYNRKPFTIRKIIGVLKNNKKKGIVNNKIN